MIENDEKKRVAVLFSEAAEWRHKSPFLNENVCKGYAVFSERALKKNLLVFIAGYNEYIRGIVRKAWVYDGEWKKAANVKPDTIYCRFNKAIYSSNHKNIKEANLKHKMAEYTGLFNDLNLEEFCWDKCMISELFPKFTPKTFLVNTVKGLKVILPEINTERVVLKPRYGTLGEGVIITTKDRLPEQIPKNTIVQEFIDGSKGIRGLVEGYHDMRIIVINGKIDHCHARIPKEGMLTANMSLGGKKIFIPNSRIPLKAAAIVKRIDKMLERYYPRLFSVDFIFDEKQRPYMIECNAHPTMYRYAFGKYKRLSYFDHVLDAIKSSIKLKVLETIE
jgi:glutathione synthase/RimK-type ligase-like ATP-grasp enzyme